MSTVFGTINSNVKTYTGRKVDGTASGMYGVKYSKKKNSKSKKYKKLNYNFKDVSNAILKANTTLGAKKAATRARNKLVMLRRKLFSSDYDDQELDRAIIHAAKMERIAKKKMKHLQEEEKIQKDCKDKSKKNNSIKGDGLTSAIVDDLSEELQEISMEKMDRLIKEMQKMLDEALEEMSKYEEELSLSEEELSYHENNKRGDLELLKKKNRSKEIREIMEADLKYLKAVFEKLDRERQEAENGNSPVALEIGGVDMPVSVSADQIPVMAEGANMDVSV